MKKSALKWSNPILMGIFLISIIWLVTDIAYDVQFWQGNINTFVCRIAAMLIAISDVYLISIFYSRLANRFILREETVKVGFSKLKEYSFVFIIAFVCINVAYLIIIYLVNRVTCNWAESILVNAVSLPIMFLLYFQCRDHSMQEYSRQQSDLVEKLKTDQLETELKFLKSQYHPHFLFNSLNTIYFQIDEKNESARYTIEILCDLLRYQLYESNQKVCIRQELDYLRRYIEMQKLRKDEDLRLSIEIDPCLDKQQIYPLLFLPLIENAFKYVSGNYWINLLIKLDGSKIIFTLENSVVSKEKRSSPRKGIGIENLLRRLELLYPNGQHSLNISDEDLAYRVQLILSI